MARMKRCLGVDLGSSRIKVAEVVVEKAGLRITRILQADLDIPPGTDEDERILRTTRALRDLLKSNKIVTKDAVFCLPGQSVFQRLIKLPRTSVERLQRIVEYEARQQIPFPLEQTRYEFQIFDNPDNAEEVEVLLAAIKKDSVNNYARLFRRTGLEIAGIGVSTLALLNFHRLDQGKNPLASLASKPATKAKKPGKFSLSLGKKKKGQDQSDEADAQDAPEGEDEEIAAFDDAGGAGDSEGGLFEEVKAYVNLGATTMDLAVQRPGRGSPWGFGRSIPHAGNELTRAVQDALGLETFGEAEEVKKGQTAVISSLFEIEGDEEKFNREASEAVTRVVDRRVIGELRRSLDFYISQPDGAAVDSIALSGGMAALPYLSGYVEEKLGVPVEVVEEFHNRSVALGDEAASADWSASALAVGLAIQGVEAADVSIDFLPDDLRTVREFKGRYREVAIMVVLLLAMIWYGFSAGTTYIQRVNVQIEELNRTNTPQTRAILDEFAKLTAERTALFDKYKKLVQISTPRDLWLQFWADVIVEKPAEVVILYLDMNSEGIVRIDGQCETQAPINDFLENLRNRSDLVTDTKIKDMDTLAVDDPYKRFRSGKVFNFKFTMMHREKINRVTPTQKAPGR